MAERDSAVSNTQHHSDAATASSSAAAGPYPAGGPSHHGPRKRKGHRAGKKRRARRKSFAVLPEEDTHGEDLPEPSGPSAMRDSLYSMRGRSLSMTSVDSEAALLDHRDQQQFLRPRRSSTVAAGSQSFLNVPSASRFRNVQTAESGDEDEDGGRSDEGAPLLSQSTRLRRHDSTGQGYGSSRASPRLSRQDSRTSSTSRRNGAGDAFGTAAEGYNVNFPPSVPASPRLGASAERPDMSFVDAMLREELHEASKGGSPEPESPEGRAEGRGAPPPFERRKSRLVQEPEDVCFPQEGLSELGEEEVLHEMRDSGGYRLHRRRRTKWPDLSYLEEWARFEKEGRTDEARAKKITEPKLVNGRLRPTHKGWFRSEEEAPYRFTYFNEEFQSTIHSQTISGLVQPGGSFRDLFIPEPRILSDSEPESEDEQPAAESKALPRPFVEPRRELASSPPPQAQAPQLQERETSGTVVQTSHPRQGSGQATPRGGASAKSSTKSQRSKADQKTTRYGDRPVWWLDILSPTEAEMKVLSKTFGIHPLTAEDIMVQEAREKVELFRHYYFVNYRTFEQDPNSENFLEPVNMYVVVFREGVLSFHFSMTPHPANVRRRIRQLRDYLILSSDWISYAIIDDITDVFVPLIQAIEEEVDDIDDAILQLHSSAIPGWSKDHSAHTHYYQKRMAAVNNGSSIWGRLNSAVRGGGDERKRLLYQQQQSEQHPERADVPQLESGADMLRRVGDCRKKVMGLYRLLGNKADVIKGFAKRCNEQWDVAPRSEIGLYLGDIQDHIVTMTGNLSHYEKILARSHQNYLAQINIRMNERQEQTADVLGKLTVLGTIVLPMNIITGLWGMNVWVPGQEYEGDLKWFLAITAGLLLFGVGCYLVAKRVYKIV